MNLTESEKDLIINSLLTYLYQLNCESNKLSNALCENPNARRLINKRIFETKKLLKKFEQPLDSKD